MGRKSRGIRKAIGRTVVLTAVAGSLVGLPARDVGATPGDVILVSTDSNGVKGAGQSGDFGYGSRAYCMSGNGARVAFFGSGANNWDVPTGLFVKDLASGQLIVVDQGSATSGDFCSMPEDGSMIVFATEDHPDPADVNEARDFYLMDLASGTLTLVSPGIQNTEAFYFPSVSADGTKVAFYVRSTNPDLPGGIFVKSLPSGPPTRVTNANEGNPVLSPDGSKLAFETPESLDPADSNLEVDVYVVDLTDGSIRWATAGDHGQAGNNAADSASLSADGTRIAFRSNSVNIYPDPDTQLGVSAVYVRDFSTGSLMLASIPADHAEGPAISANGNRVAWTEFGSIAQVFVSDLAVGTQTQASTTSAGVEGNAESRGTLISYDGTRVVFASKATNFDLNDPDHQFDVYMNELAADGPPPPPPPTFKYVALGDSFSAGEGIEPFFEPATNKCHRSTLAYSTLVNPPGLTGVPIYQLAQSGLPYEWGFQACSGAMTEDVLSTGQWGDPLPQLALDRSLDTGNPNDLPVDANTDLVTITIGGNDVGGAPGTISVGFASVLAYCWKTTDCETTLKDGMLYPNYLQKTIDDTRAKLRQVYQAILAQAPSSEVLVVGYPQLLPEAAADQNCAKLRQTQFRVVLGRPPFTIVKVVSVGFSIPEQQMIRNAAVQLNAAIADTVLSTLSPRIHFVPVDQYFAGHEICVDDQGGEWINGPTAAWKKGFVNDQSFHPKDVGQAAYAYCVNKDLQGSSC